jgi:hypothetical protein
MTRYGDILSLSASHPLQCRPSIFHISQISDADGDPMKFLMIFPMKGMILCQTFAQTNPISLAPYIWRQSFNHHGLQRLAKEEIQASGLAEIG